MADLTPHYAVLRRAVYQAGLGKEELKALPTLPNKGELLAAFQAMEDYMVGTAAPAIKADVDAALGLTTSQALFRKLFAGYLSWKLRNV